MKRKRGNIKVVVALVWRECRGRGGVEGVLVYPGRLDLCGLGWFDGGLGWFDGGLGWFGGGLGWFGVFQWTAYLVSSLQMTLEKACSDTEIFLAVSGDQTWDL